jgi:PAS domain S-box-containing protein
VSDRDSPPVPQFAAALYDQPDIFVHRALLASIIESSDDAIVSKTLEGRILSWNSGAERIFGYRPEEAIGKSITIIIPPELLDEERQILAKLGRGERIDHFDTVRLTKDGTRVAISVTVSPIRDAAGKVIGASKVARDISERKRVEQTLREANRRKDEFLAVLAHELRNPLAPIRYALAIAQKPDRTEEQQQHAEEVIARQVAHMTRLLDDLLDTSRITRGTLELKKDRVELASVLAGAIETSRPGIVAKEQKLTFEPLPHAIWLDADAVRLAQVFANLLINASKFTPARGNITLTVKHQGSEVAVSVADNGIGMAPEMIPHLFNFFSQPHGCQVHSEGLGIGLALARGLANLHGGQIDAHSRGLGQGSEFIVRLPVNAAANATLIAEHNISADQEGGPMKILVVDDNRDGADSLATMLELSGHEVQTAYAANEALALIEAFRPQVVLADIGLPDMSGYELAGRIRAMPWASSLKLVAVTGWGQQSDRQRAFDAGFNHHLTKPIAPEMLDSLLSSMDIGRTHAALAERSRVRA